MDCLSACTVEAWDIELPQHRVPAILLWLHHSLCMGVAQANADLRMAYELVEQIHPSVGAIHKSPRLLQHRWVQLLTWCSVIAM